MPRLKDSTSMARVRDAIRARTRWVFVTELGDGHRQLASLAVNLALRWELLGLCPDALLDYGLIDFCNGPTGHRGVISILTVPKSALSVDEVNSFLGCLSPRQQTDGSEDLFGLCLDTDAGREMLTLFLQAVHKGKFRVWTPQEN
jgi:hypothetical protein